MRRFIASFIAPFIAPIIASFTAQFTHKALLTLRADTPAAGAHFTHGSGSLPPACVFAARRAWLGAEERAGPQQALARFDDDRDPVHQSVARLIGAEAHQVALLASRSRAWALAFAAARAIDQPVHVITAGHEWAANAMNLLQARAHGRIAAHTRSAVGMAALPFNLPVEIEGEVEIAA